MTAASPASATLVGILLSHWLLVLIIGNAIIGSCAEALRRGRKQRLKLRKLDLRIAQANAARLPQPTDYKQPGRCVHRNVVQVMSPDDQLVAWLCRTCTTQLPADWAVRAEDL